MNCTCVSGADADSFITELSQGMRKARKPHRCCECHAAINPGDSYEDVAGVDGNAFVTYKTCGPCVEIRTHFCDGSWLYGGLWEDMENCFPELVAGGPCLKGLSAAAKAKLFAQWRDWKGL